MVKVSLAGMLPRFLVSRGRLRAYITSCHVAIIFVRFWWYGFMDPSQAIALMMDIMMERGVQYPREVFFLEDDHYLKPRA